MPLNRLQFVQLFILLFALPAQYMLTEWWGTNSEVSRAKSLQGLLSNFKEFRKSYLSLESWKSAISYVLKGSMFSFQFKTKIQNGKKSSKTAASKGECVAKEVFRYNSRYGYFSNSITVRSPRPSTLKYRVGQVIKHKIHGYRGVIIGWDETCRAPSDWIDLMHGNNIAIQRQPHYSVLVDVRDRPVQVTYVAEENIITQTNLEIHHPGVWDYFDFYDGAQYHMRPAIQELYPFD